MSRSTREQVDDRVAHIENMMASGVWERGKSNRKLAAEWGLSVAAVDDYAADAGRRVRSSLTDRDAVTEAVTTRMKRIVETGEDRDAIKAGDVWTRIVGARAPEVRAEVPLSEEQAKAKYKELTGKEWGE